MIVDFFKLPLQIALGLAVAHYVERFLARLFG
jgi:hypothetical protein